MYPYIDELLPPGNDSSPSSANFLSDRASTLTHGAAGCNAMHALTRAVSEGRVCAWRLEQCSAVPCQREGSVLMRGWDSSTVHWRQHVHNA